MHSSTQLKHAVLRVQNQEIAVSLQSLQSPQPDAGPQGHQTLQKAQIYPQAQHVSLKSQSTEWRRTQPPEPAPYLSKPPSAPFRARAAETRCAAQPAAVRHVSTGQARASGRPALPAAAERRRQGRQGCLESSGRAPPAAIASGRAAREEICALGPCPQEPGYLAWLQLPHRCALALAR